MLVEDNTADVRLIREMLADENFPVDNLEVFDRLSTSLIHLAVSDVDAILLDLGLPDSRGIGTFEKMQAAAQRIPLLILTAFKDDALALEAVRRGAQDYLIKDKIDGALLVRALKYAIERKKADEAVHTERKRLFDVLETLPAMICLITPDYHIVFANRSFRERFGESKGKPCYEYCWGQSEPCKFCESLFPLKTGNPHHWEVMGPDGSTIEAHDYPFTDTDGSKLILEMDLDITARKKAEAQAVETARKLKDAERLAAIGATAGMVGHDIRNPLQAISSDTYLAKLELASMPESEAKEGLKESLDGIEKNVDYINKVVLDLQDYARPLNPKLEESDLTSVIEGVIAKNGLPENIDAKVDVKENARKIRADPYYLNRILYNLVTNAVQAMSNGGRLTVKARKDGQDTILTVKDTGVGIPENVRDKMFTLMFTTKSKGQGFGLPVVKRMTESLGGKVTFESQEGKGSTFTVRLPPQKS